MNESHFPTLPCLCSSFRRASRALTQFYEKELRPLGLRSTQFTILQVLERAGEVSQGQLGEMLAMDSTSLTRTLAIMGREGWIRERKGKDRRERYLRLSSAGKTQLKNVLPAWEKVQSRLRRQVGSEAWSGMMQLTNQITKVVATKGDSL